MDMLRLITAGSVDDGKSTLIGRLLYDARQIMDDQFGEIQRASERRGEDGVNLALLTDGLRAEREQNITIDVAYRYFATPKRKFIIADTPGHVQYTRNMVTGASTADLAIILVDARKGALTQTRRHVSIAALLRIPHIILCVNKMDMAGYAQERFERIIEAFNEVTAKLEVEDITFIPVSALHGDNIVHKSERMPWYEGPTLMYHLEHVNVASTRNMVDFRFPVQGVIPIEERVRGLAGRIASGVIRPGEEVMALPSRFTSRVCSVLAPDGPRGEAQAGESVMLTLEDDLDISRGDMIVRKKNVPTVTTDFDAIICWTGQTPLEIGKPYVLMHTTRTTPAHVSEIVYRLNVDTLHREPGRGIAFNDLGRVRIRTTRPVFPDPYRDNRQTGGFILIDPATHDTVGAGMVKSAAGESAVAAPEKSPNVVWVDWNIPRQERERRVGHKAAVLWFTGLSAAGKSTVARGLERKLFEQGCRTMLLDGDQVRHGLCRDLGFSDADRAENIRRVAETARLFFEQANIVLCAFISPFQRDRDFARQLIPEGRFFEIYVKCALETARMRDPKRLYERAMKGEIPNFTGVTSPYEAPEQPEVVLDSDRHSPEELIHSLHALLAARGII